MSTLIEVGEMPGEMETSGNKGKKRDPSEAFGAMMFSSGTSTMEQGGGGSAPPPTPGPGGNTGGSVVIPPHNPKKHIKKPEDFTNPKDWDKFERREFLYVTGYEDDFRTHSSRI